MGLVTGDSSGGLGDVVNVPEIGFRNGKVVKVTFYECNSKRDIAGFSEFGVGKNGDYYEYHYDLEHGGSGTVRTTREKLEKLEERLKVRFPILDVLGDDMEGVSDMLNRRGIRFCAYNMI